MNYKRVFTFGCSFTNWIWPTWADIIAIQTNLPVHNGALAGLGNVGITCRMLEYDLKYKFNQNDLILVMWTGWSREDRYLDNRWIANGSVFNNNFYDQKFLKKYWSWENDIIKNSSSIMLANRSFFIGQNYSAYRYDEVDSEKEIRYESELFKTYTDNLPDTIFIDIRSNRFGGKALDQHPDILNNINFYNFYIADKFNFPKVDKTNCLYQWQQDLEDQLPLGSHIEQNEYIKEYFRTKNHLFSKT